MTRGVITTSTHTVIPIAARVMSENKISALPVMDDANNLTGIITSSDLLRVIIQELPRQKRTIQVREYMTPGVVTIQPNTSLLEAHRLMAVERIRALPVLDEDKLVGVVTRTDLMSADHPVWMDDAHDSDLAMRIELEDVSRIMSRNVITIRPEADIVEAARQMFDGKFHCLPVVDEDNQLVGILTETDLFRLITRVFY
jgi:acetoin utilization protein AcuB